MLFPVAGGEPRTLFHAADPPGRFANYQGMPWLPDGQGFLVRKRLGSTSEIWHVPLSGAPRKLAVDATPWSTGPVGARLRRADTTGERAGRSAGPPPIA